MIKEYFLKISHHWKILIRDRAYKLSLLTGILVFAAGFFVNYYFSLYHDNFIYASVGDSILNVLPTYDLEFLFIDGFYVIIFLLFAYPILVRPELAPFMLKTFGLLMLLRSGFIVLTHVGPPEGFFYGVTEDVYGGPLKRFIFRNDLFFSGHTSIPFLGFLLLRGEKFRWFFFASSIVMGATVLLMHVHYSIDVFSAFFIAHGIYVLSDRIFNDLNLRFARKIKIHGWKALQKRMVSLHERKMKKLREAIKSSKYSFKKTKNGNRKN